MRQNGRFEYQQNTGDNRGPQPKHLSRREPHYAKQRNRKQRRDCARGKKNRLAVGEQELMTDAEVFSPIVAKAAAAYDRILNFLEQQRQGVDHLDQRRGAPGSSRSRRIAGSDSRRAGGQSRPR